MTPDFGNIQFMRTFAGFLGDNDEACKIIITHA